MNFTINKHVLFLLVASFFMLNSCEDLETVPQDSVTTIDEPDEVAAVLFSAYNSIYGMMGNHNGYLSLQEISSDEALIPTRGSDWGDGGVWIRCHQHDYNADEGYVLGTWNACYTAISQINNGFNDFEGNPGLTAEVKSELRALRTLYYFFLIDVFGNVPIITEEGNQGQKTRAEVYNFIMDEIDAVSPNLSRAKYIGRMNYWTMQALKAKMILNKEIYAGQTPDWNDVVDACDDIIDNGPYALATNYFSIFDANNGGNIEHIYAIPYDEVYATGHNLAMMTLHYESQNTFNATAQPWNGYATVADFYNTYIDPSINPGPQGDVVGLDLVGSITTGTVDGRLDNFLVGKQPKLGGGYIEDAAFDDLDGPVINFTPALNDFAPGAWKQAGARIGKFKFEDGVGPDMNNDKPLFRYTDILLMKAEALYRMDPDDGVALALVNSIRQRAGVYDFIELTDENLLEERGREMFFEMWRRNDLIRFGKYNDEWLYHDADPSDHVNLFPIPRVQVEGSGLTQNPGY